VVSLFGASYQPKDANLYGFAVKDYGREEGRLNICRGVGRKKGKLGKSLVPFEGSYFMAELTIAHVESVVHHEVHGSEHDLASQSAQLEIPIDCVPRIHHDDIGVIVSGSLDKAGPPGQRHPSRTRSATFVDLTDCSGSVEKDKLVRVGLMRFVSKRLSCGWGVDAVSGAAHTGDDKNGDSDRPTEITMKEKETIPSMFHGSIATPPEAQ
jgi:hypothetical protein